MLLVLDVGNTNIKIGAYDGQKLCGSWKMASVVSRTADEYGYVLMGLLAEGNIRSGDIDGIIISSVIPSLNYTFGHLCRHYFKIDPMMVGKGTRTRINIKYENPKEVGADRIVNCVSAYEKYGAPCVVVDFGTATTFSVINRDGEFVGGCIAPGLKMSCEALTQKTSKLPKIELEFPRSLIGHNTVSGMQSGTMYGHIGMVDYLLEGIMNELGERAFVVATGGMSKLIAERSKYIDKVDSLLTLDGLMLLYQINKENGNA
ncbi:MAG: type III pantothenate kinase [Eubacteriales bacterium]|nr:type III pantothenate kinase [Eubacteriales bacterium]